MLEEVTATLDRRTTDEGGDDGGVEAAVTEVVGTLEAIRDSLRGGT
jgi:hypothetical protein